ncbi:MAG TPA: 3-deoxy-8-phosphooctulonate synthase [Bacteroidia bacterium]|nr:3-deoxy-8-phosphooctulonate synthase [Bacteroidia bacterium]
MKHFTLIAGPCIIEDEAVAFEIATRCKEIADRLQLDLVFKGSYKKANRTKLSSFSTMGEQDALEILGKIRSSLGLRVITDVHETTDCAVAAQYVDVLQVPAFLCRQTDLLIAAGNTGKTVNIKKGQFMAPESMKHAQEKVMSTGNKQVWLTERGTTFGYEYLVVDMTAMPKMRRFNDHVIMDCTHSVQRPNQDGATGGDPEMIETIALSAIAAGATGLFLEVHPEPWKSSSDATNILQIDKLEPILRKCIRVKQALEG